MGSPMEGPIIEPVLAHAYVPAHALLLAMPAKPMLAHAHSSPSWLVELWVLLALARSRASPVSLHPLFPILMLSKACSLSLWHNNELTCTEGPRRQLTQAL